MAIFYVYLADPLGCVPSNMIAPININLQSIFKKCVAASGNAFSDAFVHWLAYKPTPQPHELMLYFLPDRGKSVVAEIGLSPSRTSAGSTGWTTAQGAVSEIYMSEVGKDADLAAALGFHELMHNKLRLNDPQLHPRGGLAGTNVSSIAQLSNSNIADMAAALRNNAPQYAAGLMSAINGRNDPVSRYYTF